MATTYYKRTILEYLHTRPREIPVTTDMVTAYMRKINGEPEDKVRKAVNVNLARLESEGVLSRIMRGVYCKRVKTPFGDYVPGKDILYGRLLVLENDHVIGYETGLSLMNQIGLISQMPRRKVICSNRYNLTVPAGVDIDVRKPRESVTHDNFKYLQILDIIDELDTAPVDAPNPEEIIRDKASRAGLLSERLILYARKLYSAKTLQRTVDIILGEL